MLPLNMGAKGFRSWRWILSLAILVVAALETPRFGTTAPINDDDSLVFVTEDSAFGGDGCDAISVFAINSAVAVERGFTRVSPGRLAATTSLTRVLAINANLGAPSFLYDLQRSGSNARPWQSSGYVDGANFHLNGGLAISPDNDTVLITTTPHRPNYIARPGPVSISKYRISEIRNQKIGPMHGAVTLTHAISEILIDPDGRMAHALSISGELITIDIESMLEVESRIQGARPRVDGFGPEGAPAEYFHGAQSPSGRYIVTNLWQGRAVTIFDVEARTAATASLPYSIIGGVAFNHADANHGLLALHADTSIRVFRFDPPSGLSVLSSAANAPPPIPHRGVSSVTGPLESIAWSGTGEDLIAATSVGAAEFRVFHVADGGTTLSAAQLLVACPNSPGGNYPNDILTSNRIRLPTPTPTSATPPPTIPPPTDTASPPPTDTPTPSPSPTPPPSATPSPTAAPTLWPIYLPISIRERCTPTQQRADVALVIDASSSMLEPTAAGRTKLAAAIDAAAAFLGSLRLEDGDQAAVVAFNVDARLVQPLTVDRPALAAALGGIATAQLTRIDLGIAVGHAELIGPRRHPGNRAVLIVLTDGRANPVPPEVAVANAGLAKADGIEVHAIGLGTDLDVDALQSMASSPAHFHRAPDAEQLAEIYRAIAVTLPCPAEQRWPGGP